MCQCVCVCSFAIRMFTDVWEKHMHIYFLTRQWCSRHLAKGTHSYVKHNYTSYFPCIVAEGKPQGDIHSHCNVLDSSKICVMLGSALY